MKALGDFFGERVNHFGGRQMRRDIEERKLEILRHGSFVEILRQESLLEENGEEGRAALRGDGHHFLEFLLGEVALLHEDLAEIGIRHRHASNKNKENHRSSVSGK